MLNEKAMGLGELRHKVSVEGRASHGVVGRKQQRFLSAPPRALNLIFYATPRRKLSHQRPEQDQEKWEGIRVYRKLKLGSTQMTDGFLTKLIISSFSHSYLEFTILDLMFWIYMLLLLVFSPLVTGEGDKSRGVRPKSHRKLLLTPNDYSMHQSSKKYENKSTVTSMHAQTIEQKNRSTAETCITRPFLTNMLNEKAMGLGELRHKVSVEGRASHGVVGRKQQRFLSAPPRALNLIFYATPRRKLSHQRPEQDQEKWEGIRVYRKLKLGSTQMTDGFLTKLIISSFSHSYLEFTILDLMFWIYMLLLLVFSPLVTGEGDKSRGCKEPFRAALSFKSVESSVIVFYVKVYIKCQELSVHAQREPGRDRRPKSKKSLINDDLGEANGVPEGAPVAKERPVTLSDFDQLLYEEHSLYQLFEYQGFIHQLSWTEGFCVDAVVQDFFCALVSVDRAPEVQLEVRGVQFLFSADVIADFLNCPRPESPCFPAVPLNDEQRTSEQDLWTLMTGKTSAVVGSIIKQRAGAKRALTRRFARRAAAAVEEASRPSTSASEAPMETGAPAVPPPWVAQLFADFDSRVGATMKATLQPFERRMQSMEEQLKELRTAFDGECTVTMLRNKSVVAHMADVNEQLEEIKKTLDDFKMEADPQRIPGDIPDDVATFRDAVRR
ncbi:hypothetical protein CJ030_MR7G028106 [Morella rubra]|uniref:Uncharacterized protein n=2 Tax=Morella rubra TaxID=262757 RepID=A0A6A1UZA2_9ROSI|nr:hypothetical protein CJ030_MR7G028106 [Morella rubra]